MDVKERVEVGGLEGGGLGDWEQEVAVALEEHGREAQEGLLDGCLHLQLTPHKHQHIYLVNYLLLKKPFCFLPIYFCWFSQPSSVN